MQFQATTLAEHMRLLMAQTGESNRDVARAVSELLGYDVSYETIRRLAKGIADEHAADLMVVSALAMHWDVPLSELSPVVYERTVQLVPLVQNWKMLTASAA